MDYALIIIFLGSVLFLGWDYLQTFLMSRNLSIEESESLIPRYVKLQRIKKDKEIKMRIIYKYKE